MKQLFEQVTVSSAEFHALSGEDAPLLFRVMVAGEDRRARYHLGVDVISILRALLTGLRTGRVSGLSTIEQQLVRAVIPRTTSPLRSKPRELLLSVMLASRYPKETLWAAYLGRAYLGADWDDFRSARIALAGTGQLDLRGACAIIACLKYPQPETKRSSWARRHTRRVQHLAWLVERTERAGDPHAAGIGPEDTGTRYAETIHSKSVF